jgi:hypothetical protein
MRRILAIRNDEEIEREVSYFPYQGIRAKRAHVRREARIAAYI